MYPNPTRKITHQFLFPGVCSPASSAPTATTRTFSTITKGERPHPTWLPPLQSESKQTCGVCRCRTPHEHGTVYKRRTTNTSCNTSCIGPLGLRRFRRPRPPRHPYTKTKLAQLPGNASIIAHQLGFLDLQCSSKQPFRLPRPPRLPLTPAQRGKKSSAPNLAYSISSARLNNALASFMISTCSPNLLMVTVQ